MQFAGPATLGGISQVSRPSCQSVSCQWQAILTEGRAVVGVLRPVFREYHVPVASINGFCGGFLRTDVAPLLKSGDRVSSVSAIG